MTPWVPKDEAPADAVLPSTTLPPREAPNNERMPTTTDASCFTARVHL